MKNREELVKVYNQVVSDIKNGYYINEIGSAKLIPEESILKISETEINIDDIFKVINLSK